MSKSETDWVFTAGVGVGTAGIQSVEAEDAAKRLRCCTENALTPNVARAEDEEAVLRLCAHLFPSLDCEPHGGRFLSAVLDECPLVSE